MKAAMKATSIALLLVLSTGCPGSERSDMPKPDDPSTGTKGIDTVPPSAPAPGHTSDNPAPLNNDETTDDKANPSDNTQKHGASAEPGAATPTTH
jgi:hypothetical protein